MLVLRSIGCECAGLDDHFTNRLWRNIRSAGISFAVILVHRYADTAIVAVFQILHFAKSSGRR